MTVRKRPSSPYYQYRFKLDGVSHSGSTKETNPGKARQFEARLMVKIREGGRNPHIRKSPLLRDFAPTFLKFIRETQNLKPKTKSMYEYGWGMLAKTKLAGMRLNEIGTADADVIAFPGSGSNANKALGTLSIMLSHACTLDLLKSRPRINLRDEKRRNTLIDLWLEDMIVEMAPPTLRTILTIMGQCGMRGQSEVCRMRWEHVRWQENGVLVPEGKTDAAERWVPMSQHMKEALAGQKARNERRAKRRGVMPSEWVFPSPSSTGHYMNLSGVWARTMVRVRAAAEKRNLPAVPADLVPYCFRHMFATHYLEASGNNQAALKKIMGHSSMRVTERYLHPGVTDAAATMDEFNSQRRGLRLVKEA